MYNQKMPNIAPINLPFSVGISPQLGFRGLIAARNIKKNEILEKCPIVLIGKKEEEALKKTVIWKYYFEWNDKHHCLCLGYGSLFNHSYSPNAKYTFDFKNKLLVFRSIMEIKQGEEITINYNFEPSSKDPLEPELIDHNKHQQY